MYTIPKLLLITGMISLASCKDEKDDVIDTVNREGAIETSITVQHADSTRDILVTTHKVWTHFSEYRTVVHLDTIPALGMVSTIAENADGNTKNVSVKKDYEIYITVK